MIESLAFYSLKNDEYYTFGNKVRGVLSDFDLEALLLKPLHGRVEAAVNLLDEALVKTSTKPLTLSLNEADRDRDNGFLALRFNLLACSKRLKPEWNKAANLLIDAIRTYGWTLQSEPFATETSKLRNLIADFEGKPNLKAAIELLQLTEWLAELKQSQLNFETTDKSRLELKASRTEIKAEEACLEVRKSCELLFQYINMTQELNPNDEFAKITRLMNEVIAEFTLTINQRKASKSKEETTEEVVTNE
jgi:hypothetical protein